MTTARVPVRDTYDAQVDLLPRDGVARSAFGVLKRTYRITTRGLEVGAPSPLRDPLRGPAPGSGWLWPHGSDLWPLKDATDVVVEGFAWAVGGRPVTEVRCGVRVGRRRKIACVRGRRRVEGTSRRPRIGPPEPFVRVALDAAHAYGGIDRAVRDPDAEPLRAALGHPGAYPRNPLGKGYRVAALGPGEELELPEVEDPADPLTIERLVTRDPRRWVHQPLPWTFGWQPAHHFVRSHLLGFRPYYPVSTAAALPEVARGLLPPDVLSRARRALAGEAPEPLFFREASLGLSFAPPLGPGTPIEVTGMHPERARLAFTVPPPPAMVLGVEGQAEAVETRILHVVIHPHDERVTFTWAGIRWDLPRAFLPGLHGEIPLWMTIDGDRPLRYATPRPVRATVGAAEREAG
ncbi:MAG: DUF2169 domain-containing protein [Sandaracinaceae bacterium]